MKSIIHHIGKEILGIYFGGFLTFDAALLINSPEYRIWRQLIFISHFDNSKVIKLLLYHYPGEHERTAVNQLCIKKQFHYISRNSISKLIRKPLKGCTPNKKFYRKQLIVDELIFVNKWE